MKRWVILMLLTFTGCAEQKPGPIPDTYDSLDTWQVHASEQVRGWVPLNTPSAEAKRIMEQHRFTTISNGPSFLVCYYTSSGSLSDPVLECIDVSFDLNNGRVSAEHVLAYLKGP